MSAASPLTALRAELTRRQLDGFVVPKADEFQGEYIAPDAERLAWVTNFTGSAGTAVILADRAWLFVDGRYTIQAAQEVAGQNIDVRVLSDQPLYEILGQELSAGLRLGYDPWLHSADQVEHLHQACARAKAQLVAVETNPVDAVWLDRPAPPQAPLVVHPVEFAGRCWTDKVQDVLGRMNEDALILPDPSTLAWLLNIRGQDVPFTPLALGRAILYRQGARVEIFMDPAKVPPPIAADFGPNVQFKSPADLPQSLQNLSGQKVRIDGAQAPAALLALLEQAQAVIIKDSDPCIALRAEKNAVELAGARAAHRRDAAALVRFLAWLETAQNVDELQVAEITFTLRAQGRYFRDLSFPTIAGFGPNGAIVHYRSTAATNRPLTQGSFLLLDSGAQYLDGTTDITRTIAIGPVGAEERKRYTQVLKGHIAVARAVFPTGTSGSQLDVLARLALWADGVDYDHGTGHGVGSYLSVHEGPQRISKIGNRIALKPGHILSNEPGYYKAGHYGIRLENLLAVVEMPHPPGAERSLLGFEVLTLVPFDRNAIVPKLLTPTEIDWLNGYHARIQKEIGPLVDGDAAQWLTRATTAISLP